MASPAVDYTKMVGSHICSVGLIFRTHKCLSSFVLRLMRSIRIADFLVNETIKSQEEHTAVGVCASRCHATKFIGVLYI